MWDKVKRLTQGERRQRSRDALLEAAARGISRQGYANLVLEQVAAEAGYTRGALYHQFAGKEDLALAVVAWVQESWYDEMTPYLTDIAEDPLEQLLAVARGHAVYCRKDVARVMTALRVELGAQDHPVGRAVQAATDQVVEDCARLVRAGRRTGSIPAGPPARVVASAVVGAVEGLVINVTGRAPHDVRLAQGAVLGLLGLPPRP